MSERKSRSAGAGAAREFVTVAHNKHPTLANGKICYLEIPALDVRRSAEFYEKVFGWRVRQRGDGSIAFDDGAEEVSGTWVLGRPPATSPGLLVHFMVDSVAATIDAVIAHGGALVQPIGAGAPEITARFRDPAGNVFGLYQEPRRSSAVANQTAGFAPTPATERP
ncbi:MAG: VOC family protein [Verrucomicrobia bacterium]|nr:VOC family protein [Verrucomicrobiota bacterium]